jgi:TfoX/Sxy family transcriptional regulator of competence genes
MAYSEELAERVREIVSRKKDIEEKKLFGGIGFLLNGNILVCVWKEFLIVRLGLEEGEKALKEKSVIPFDVTGKPMKGWAMVVPDGVEEDSQLKKWIQRSMKFVETLPAK